jgi:hypothetical protein
LLAHLDGLAMRNFTAQPINPVAARQQHQRKQGAASNPRVGADALLGRRLRQSRSDQQDKRERTGTDYLE